MMPLGSKLAPPRWVTYSKHRNKEGKLQNFSSLKLERVELLYLVMKHLLVVFYQDCSYDAPGVKTGPASGVTSSKHRNKEGKLLSSSFLKLQGAEL